MLINSIGCGSSNVSSKKDEVDVLKLKKQLDATNVNFILLGEPESSVTAKKVKVTGGSINSVILAQVVVIESDSEVRIGENARIFCGTLFTDCPSLALSQAVKAGKIFVRPGGKCVNWIERDGDADFLILREGNPSFSF